LIARSTTTKKEGIVAYPWQQCLANAPQSNVVGTLFILLETTTEIKYVTEVRTTAIELKLDCKTETNKNVKDMRQSIYKG
jgi:hypothetical protein